MYHTARWSSGLRLRPLTPATWVRIPYGSPKKTARKRCMIYEFNVKSVKDRVGVYDDEGPPVPIPNTVVKLIRAENTWLEAARENRSMPTFYESSSPIGELFFCVFLLREFFTELF